MKPAMFEAMTHVLGEPTNWRADEHGECLGLPVNIDTTKGGTFTSCWVLDAEEVAAIVNGGRVYLTVFGCSHPPVAISVRPK